MGSSSSKPQKLKLEEIPSNIRTRSRYVLYIMTVYPEGVAHGATPLWTGSYDEIIHDNLTTEKTLYGWGSSKPFIKKDVEKFVNSIDRRDPEVQVKYRVVGPN